MVAECRLVTIPQLAALLSRNGKGLNKRISQLVAQGLLADAPRGPGQRRGRPERVILPTLRGIEVLQERKLIDPQMPNKACAKVSWCNSAGLNPARPKYSRPAGIDVGVSGGNEWCEAL